MSQIKDKAYIAYISTDDAPHVSNERAASILDCFPKDEQHARRHGYPTEIAPLWLLHKTATEEVTTPPKALAETNQFLKAFFERQQEANDKLTAHVEQLNKELRMRRNK